MLDAAKCGEFFLEVCNRRSADEGAGCHDIFENWFELGFDLTVLDFKVKKWDLHKDSWCQGWSFAVEVKTGARRMARGLA